MKHIVLFAGFSIILISTLSLANSAWVEAWQSGAARDTLIAGDQMELRLYTDNTIDLGGLSISIEISGSPDVQWIWDSPKADTSQWAGLFSLTGSLLTYYDVDGILPDEVLFGGATIIPIPPATRYLAYRGTTDTAPAGTVRTLCLDTTMVPPEGPNVFVDEFGTAFSPNWLPGNQPSCWPVVKAEFICGDANMDGEISIVDAVYIVNFVFKFGPQPYPLGAGDANCDGACNVADAIYLLNFIFKEGQLPCCP